MSQTSRGEAFSDGDVDRGGGAAAREGAPAAASAGVAAAARPNGHEVLVVEDDPEINELVGAYAEIAGFHYRSAATGEEALSAIHRHLPALIILDLMLPDLDGLEICRRVKSEPLTAGVPVIILTAMDSDRTRRQGLACGAAEYVTKPFDPEALMEIMARLARHEGHG